MEIAPPSHLAMPVVDEAEANTAAQEAADDDLLRLQNKRDKKHDKKDRRRNRQEDHKERRRDQRNDKDDRARNRKENRRERAESDGCEDFDSFDEAQAFCASIGYDRVTDPFDLDRDGDGLACNEKAPAPTTENG